VPRCCTSSAISRFFLEQDAELLARLEAHGEAAVVEHRIPGREDGALQDVALHEAQRAGAHELELSDGGIADALDLLQAFGGRVDDLGERAEALDQALGDRLGVAAGDGREQHQLQQLVVGERLGAAGDEALLQALAVAGTQVGLGKERGLSGVRTAVLQAAAHGASPVRRSDQETV
jgi:hypothetical protein